jgi:hypothetical protein
MALSIPKDPGQRDAESGTPRKKLTAYCRSHCATCGRHFYSDKAFDRHRVGSFDDPSDPRRCELPEEVGLEPLTREGACKVYARRTEFVCAYESEDSYCEHREGFGIERDVTLWTLKGLAERRTRLERLQAARQGRDVQPWTAGDGGSKGRTPLPPSRGF